MGFTHFNESGRAKMVSVVLKENTTRIAIARGTIQMKKETLDAIINGRMKKGDVLNVAQIAGIMGAKKTHELIPMCHNILIEGVDLGFEMSTENNEIYIVATVSTVGKTGVEMEALTAVTTAALTIYDMCKSMDKEMVIKEIVLLEKQGGKSGHFKRKVVDDNEC